MHALDELHPQLRPLRDEVLRRSQHLLAAGQCEQREGLVIEQDPVICQGAIGGDEGVEQPVLAQVVADEKSQAGNDQAAGIAAPSQASRTRIGIDLPRLHPGPARLVRHRGAGGQPLAEGAMDGVKTIGGPYRIGVIDQPVDQAPLHLARLRDNRDLVHGRLLPFFPADSRPHVTTAATGRRRPPGPRAARPPPPGPRAR